MRSLFRSARRLLQKEAGLLVPVFALRHAADFGIGDTLAVRRAIDFCAAQGFGVLQTLPIHETIGDHSPYNPVTARGLSPSLLTLSPEEVPGLKPDVIERQAPERWLAQLRQGTVMHGTVHALKLGILREASRAFFEEAEWEDLRAEYAAFCEAQKSWLPAYTLFRLLVREYEGNPNWQEWRPEHQSLAGAERWLAADRDWGHLERVRESFAYIQWVAWRQWKSVRAHASQRGVRLMGELPFGVARSSSDVWAHPELFDLDWNMGTPPIVYFDTNKDSERFGQNWGFPPYRWAEHRVDDFQWLRERVASESQFFHICRIDHLRGYFRAYQFPWGGGAVHSEFSQLPKEEIRRRTGNRWPRFVPGSGEDAASAQANAVQGHQLILVLQQAAGEMILFAEIMGQLPPYMGDVIEKLALPNLVFPQLERNADRSLRPAESYRSLSLASYANHDHAPLAALLRSWQARAQEDPTGAAAIDLRNLLGFAGWKGEPPAEMNDALLAAFQEALFATPSVLAVLLSSDLFGLPQRFNLPGSYGADTWNQRLALPLEEYAVHPVYGPRLATASRLIQASGRGAPPAPVSALTDPVAA